MRRTDGQPTTACAPAVFSSVVCVFTVGESGE
jgi:hypothetical protein